MTKENTTTESSITREQMIQLLNEDLAGEYQAIIAYTVYSQVLKGAAYTDIARELEAHAGEELAHAIKIAKQIDYLGGMPGVTPKPVKTSNDPVEMLRADLENERTTVGRYRERIRQAEAMGEFALSETLRAIIVQEQEHEIDLAAALGMEVPPAIVPVDARNEWNSGEGCPCLKAINPATRKNRSVRRNTSKPATRKRESARKPRKHGLGPPSTNSAAAAKRAAPAGRKPIEIMPALTTKQIRLHLKAVPNWSKRAQTIFRTFKFEGFLKSIDFVNRIARRAQKINHHPDIDIRFDKVTLTLTTHDEGGITEKDFSLARQCDDVLSKYFVS